MSIAALIRQMTEAGAPIEAVLIAVEAIEASQAAVDAKRAAERDRKRRQRERGKDGTVAGQSRDSHADMSDDPPLSAPPNDIYSNPPHLSPNSQTCGRDAFPCPEWCEPAVWADLKRNRKAKRLANTATAHSQFIRDIQKLATDEWPPGEVVREIAARGWGGAYDPREAGKPNNARTNHRTERSTTRQTGERVAARFAAGSGGAAHILPRLGPPGGYD